MSEPVIRKIGRGSPRAIGVVSVFALAAAGAAQAAGNVGWVWGNQPGATSAYTPTAAYSFNSSGGAITITPEGTGVYNVQFAGLYSGHPDIVQATAYATSGYCMSDGWGKTGTNTVEATVACFNAAGAPANNYFTLLYVARSGAFGTAHAGLAFLYDDNPTAPNYTPPTYQYNSSGGTNSIVRNSVGNYTVSLPGLTKDAGDVQVTAELLEGLPARCTTGGWSGGRSGTTVQVLCYNASGAPADTAYDLSYALHEPFGLVTGKTTPGAFAWANEDTSASYTPSPQYQYNGLRTGALTATRGGTGTYSIAIPSGATAASSNVLITSYGGGSNYCNVVDWSLTQVNVDCYSQGGVLADTEFDVTLQTAK